MAKLTEEQRKDFEALRRIYLNMVPARIADIRTAVDEAKRRRWARGDVEALYHLVHRLVGSSAIYGLKDVSRAARALEEGVTGLLEGRPAHDALGDLAEAVERAWRDSSDGVGRRRGN
jgi:HPt (histidine-containing phosphotransfer) domain-containing protein